MGVVNDMGVSAMSFIAEKMPEVAYNALSQYVLQDRGKRQVRWFINTLENYDNSGLTVDKTPLEVRTLKYSFISSFLFYIISIWEYLIPTVLLLI